MTHESWHRCSILLGIGIIAGIVFGLIEAALWFFGLIPTIRAIIPYATADALLIFGVTALIAAFLPGASSDAEGHKRTRILHGFSDFVTIIMIAATVFLLFVQVFLGTLLPFALKVVFAIIGALSFWIMLLTFVAFIISLARRR